MADMVKLFVNGVEVEVEAGKNLIDAIGAVGIEIPHLCYHPALGADGNCRMCLVGIEDGRPPLVPACKTPAMAGMKVLLDAEHIRKIQRDVMELELINHPTDCPVCDQAGECRLQDYYMSYDRRQSRMTVPQVVKGKKMAFGCGVVHDQERCVLCGRCVRFCRQITKTGELGIINRSDDARVNIFPGRPLHNRYALNVVDLCPVGAMTSADFRFQQRVWFLKKSPGVCHGCARGCSITVDHNREKEQEARIYRLRPRHNPLVNGYFICDSGRMSYKAEEEGRLNEARHGRLARSVDQALLAVAEDLAQGGKITFILSPDSSLEQMVTIRALAEKLGATLSGFSDGWIIPGDGDDFLIRDDKAANRAGLELLGIDCSRTGFTAAVEAADLVVNCNNDLGRSLSAEELGQLFQSRRLISFASHRREIDNQAEIVIPVASWSEYAGSVINCQGILQHFPRAVVRNQPPMELVELIARLGSPLQSEADCWQELARLPGLPADPATIPTEGLQLNDNEAAHDQP